MCRVSHHGCIGQISYLLIMILGRVPISLPEEVWTPIIILFAAYRFGLDLWQVHGIICFYFKLRVVLLDSLWNLDTLAFWVNYCPAFPPLFTSFLVIERFIQLLNRLVTIQLEEALAGGQVALIIDLVWVLCQIIVFYIHWLLFADRIVYFRCREMLIGGFSHQELLAYGLCSLPLLIFFFAQFFLFLLCRLF